MKVAGYTQDQINAAEAEYRQSQIIDEKLQSQLDLLKNYGELNQRIDSWKRRVIQMAEAEPITHTGTPGTGGGLTWEQQQEMLRRSGFFSALNSDKEKDSQIIPTEELIEFEEIFEEETEELIKTAQEQTRATIDLTGATQSVINSLGSAMHGLSKLLGGDDTTAGQIVGKIGDFIEDIGPLLKIIAFFAGGSGGGGFAEILSGLAGSFASGGIVPGTSYTGDRLFARVNSGEMILNRSQQAALYSGGHVEFEIEGSKLRGVLDNYDAISAM